MSQTQSIYLSPAHAPHQPPKAAFLNDILRGVFSIHFAFTGELKVIFHLAGSKLLIPLAGI